MFSTNCTQNRLKHFSLFFLCFFLCGLWGGIDIHAQGKAKFSIVSFEADPLDLSPRNPEYEKFDGSGDRYAIIKVTSNNPDDDLSKFDFNFGYMKHIVEMHDGVLWIYVQRNAKHVSITREGYVPINKYDLHTTIESGKAYVMTISTEGKRVRHQMVQFKIEPKRANYSIQIKRNSPGATNELFGTTDSDGTAAKSLELGTYTYEILSEDHHTQEGRFTLSDQTRTHIENVTLRPNYATVTLKVNADAEIHIDGEPKGVRQWSGKLKPGSHYVECIQANHKSTSQYISLTENTFQEITLKAPEAILGTIAITSEPSGASIKIDGKDYGITPRNLELPVGKHKITLSKDTHGTRIQEIVVKEKETETIHISLKRSVRVKFNTTPSSASLRIDGVNKTGTEVQLDAGNHTVEVYSQSGKYIPIKKQLLIDGTQSSYSFNLKKRPMRKSDFYLAAGFSVGHTINVSATIGGHISNFNLEGSFDYSLTGSEDIYWYEKQSPSEHSVHSSTSSYEPRPAMIISAKAGYGIIVGSRFKFTPQIGYRHIMIVNKYHTALSYRICTTLGVRAHLAFSSHFGLSFTPEYAFRIKQGDFLELLSTVSSKIKHWGSGFSANLSFVVSF